jgi:hypothetical protein
VTQLQNPVSRSLLCLVALAACHVPNHSADLANNEIFYADVPFRTKAPGDRPVFVAPMVDARSAVALPTHDRGFPITYSGDEFWERPVVEMVGDVLLRQLEASELFPAVAVQAAPEALVVKPQLVAFLGGRTEAVAGARTFAEVGVRLQVFGPADASGSRAVLHEQTYGSRQVSPQELNPVSAYRLVGRALQQAMAKLLTGLDGSNVARSQVPTDGAAGVASEASAPTR